MAHRSWDAAQRRLATNVAITPLRALTARQAEGTAQAVGVARLRVTAFNGFVRLRCTLRRTARSAPPSARLIVSSSDAPFVSTVTLGSPLSTTLIRHVVST